MCLQQEAILEKISQLPGISAIEKLIKNFTDYTV
jgi:hypothetical protein